MITIEQKSPELLFFSGELSRFDDLDKIPLPKLSATSIDADLSAVSAIDTAGLAWLLQVKYRFSEQQQRLNYLNPSEKLIKLASISGVNELLGI